MRYKYLTYCSKRKLSAPNLTSPLNLQRNIFSTCILPHRALIFIRVGVTVCSASFNITKFYILPTVYLCFVYIGTANFAPYTMIIGFLTAVESVYCSVGTRPSNKTD
jgi:hypothetical protein